MSFCSFSKELKKQNGFILDNLFLTEYMPDADGTAVKVYLYSIAFADDSDITALSLADKLGITEQDVISAFRYWESFDLVRFISLNPLSVEFLPIPKNVGKPRKYDLEKYSDFTATVQALIPERMISVGEYSHYFSVMEENKISPDALLLIIKYCVDLKGKDIGYRYILKVVSDFISRGLTTFNSIENELSTYVLQSSVVSSVITELGLKRKADIEDVKYYKKWINEYGFTDNLIMCAVKTLKKGKIEQLDKFLTELYTYKLFSEQDIKNYALAKQNLFDLAVKINKTISLYYEVLDPVVENYVSPWVNLGYDEKSLLFLAQFCFKSSIRTLDGMDNIVKKLYADGIVSFESILQYFEQIGNENEYLKKLFAQIGISKLPTEWDRKALASWREWGFSDEMIELACSLACGKASPLSYVNKILSDWKAKGIFSPDKVQNKATSQFESQREYSDDYFDSLLTKVANTKI